VRVADQSALLNAYPVVADKDGCALILDGSGKASAFDHTQNAFFGGGALHQRSSTCITYSTVNAALVQALTDHHESFRLMNPSRWRDTASRAPSETMHLNCVFASGVEIPEQEWMPEQLATGTLSGRDAHSSSQVSYPPTSQLKSI